MLGTLSSPAGKEIITAAYVAAVRQFRSDLANGNMGSPRVWIDIALLGPVGAYILGDLLMIGESGNISLRPEEEICDTICAQQRQRSIRTALPCHEAEELGDTRRDDETDYMGNAVRDLTPGGTYKIIVSGAGPREDASREICGFVADFIAQRIPNLFLDPDLVRPRTPVSAS